VRDYEARISSGYCLERARRRVIGDNVSPSKRMNDDGLKSAGNSGHPISQSLHPTLSFRLPDIETVRRRCGKILTLSPNTS